MNRSSCQDPYDSAISMREALRLIGETVSPVTGQESVALVSALGRVVAEAMISPLDVPPHRNSAMDGYALSGADLEEGGGAELKLVGTAMAGAPFTGRIAPGECIRIMTGAKMPDEADTVVIQEQTELVADGVRISGNNRPGQNVRQAGEDIRKGSAVLQAGHRIGAAEMGLLASLGIGEMRVRRRPRVAFFSSGDEIRSLGEPLGEGEIYDSNRFTLQGMLGQLGVELLDLGVIPDREAEIEQALSEAVARADLVLTSGGVSVGDADYIATSFRKLGKILFNKVAIKPGRPLTFGLIQETPFFGLPGNPVAVMATFYQFVRPALKRIMGECYQPAPTFRVRCRSRLKLSPGRTEIQRGILKMSETGELEVSSTGRQGSGVLSSMSAGNCFILLEGSVEGVSDGDWVPVQPFALFES